VLKITNLKTWKRGYGVRKSILKSIYQIQDAKLPLCLPWNQGFSHTYLGKIAPVPAPLHACPQGRQNEHLLPIWKWD